MQLYNPEDFQRSYEENARQPLEKITRPPFWRDYQRVVSSPAFRRLTGKTQLYPGNESDFFRNRLTHSLEVAQIGKSITFIINSEINNKDGIPNTSYDAPIDTDLVMVACIAHDLGHPPFGHQGETALNAKMKFFGGFEGNAQTLRILSKLEKKIVAYQEPKTEVEGLDNECNDLRFGLNLCYRTLASILKYDNLIPKYNKTDDVIKGYYYSEKDLVEKIKEKVLGSEYTVNEGEFKSIECQIMDQADDIAYSTYDLEDSFKGGFLSPLDLMVLPNSIIESIAKKILRIFQKTNEIEIINDFQKLFSYLSETEEITIEQSKKLSQFIIKYESQNEKKTQLDLVRESEDILVYNLGLYVKHLILAMFHRELKFDQIGEKLSKDFENIAVKDIPLYINKVVKDSALSGSYLGYLLNNEITKNGYVRTDLSSTLIRQHINDLTVDKVANEHPSQWKVRYSDFHTRFRILVLKELNYHLQIQSNSLKIVEFRGKEIVNIIFDSIMESKGLFLPNDFNKQYLFVDKYHSLKIIEKFIEAKLPTDICNLYLDYFRKNDPISDSLISGTNGILDYLLANSKSISDKRKELETVIISTYSILYERECLLRRIVTDFISCMTDRYAINFYGRLKSEEPDTIFKKIE